MNPLTILTLFLTLLLHQTLAASNIHALYLFKDVMKSNTAAIQTNTFTHLIIFGVGILADGNIMYYSNTAGSSDVQLTNNGTYIGGDALAAKVRSFKTGSTSVIRVEICTNSNNIAALMRSPGSGTNTPLARNLAVLKTAWNLDAVNNNDEAIYDKASTVLFGRMVGSLGYKYSLVPYTRQAYWVDMVKTLGTSLMDIAYLQCYDGGAGNDPVAWQNALGVKVVPLLWVTNDSKPVYGQTPAQARTKFTAWQARSALGGGGYWNEYDIEKMGLSYTEYGSVLASVFR